MKIFNHVTCARFIGFRIRERIYWLYTRWDFIFVALSYGLGDKREDIGGVIGWFYWLMKQVCWGEVMAV